MTYTMAERKDRGETIVKKNGAEVVHGRVLAADFLADHERLLAEHDALHRTVSPYRSDYDEIASSIESDLADSAANLAYAVKAWLEDREIEQWRRDGDICREIELSDYYDMPEDER